MMQFLKGGTLLYIEYQRKSCSVSLTPTLLIHNSFEAKFDYEQLNLQHVNLWTCYNSLSQQKRENRERDL